MEEDLFLKELILATCNLKTVKTPYPFVKTVKKYRAWPPLLKTEPVSEDLVKLLLEKITSDI